MKAVFIKICKKLPIDTILGKMIQANDLSSYDSPIDSWPLGKSESWLKDILSNLEKQKGRTPLERFKEAKFSILPTRQVAAGIQLDSGIIALTTGYLDYLKLIAIHISATEAMRKLETIVLKNDSPIHHKELVDAHGTMTRLHVAIGLGHLEGRVDCSEVLKDIQTLSFENEIAHRYANWILFTFLHELGHLDIFKRNISIPLLKEELYCDAFALKGWHSDSPLIGYVGDILVLFTYQWPIDLRYHGQNTHPPTFERSRMILDTMNVNGIFDELTKSLEDFWSKGHALIFREEKKKINDVKSLRFEKEKIKKQYSTVVNMIFKLADSYLRKENKHNNEYT